MPSIRKRNNSYEISVSAGRDITGKQIRHFKTYTPSPGMTQKKIDKELARIAVEFENDIAQGIAVDSNIRFADYAQRWLDINEARYAPLTHARYKTLLIRINQAIGHLRIGKITAMHLQNNCHAPRGVLQELRGNNQRDNLQTTKPANDKALPPLYKRNPSRRNKKTDNPAQCGHPRIYGRTSYS